MVRDRPRAGAPNFALRSIAEVPGSNRKPAATYLVVPDDDVSHEHAEFQRRWDGVFLRDLDSGNDG